MHRVWSDENRTAKCVAIESALAKVQGKLGLIPPEAAAEIIRVCDIPWAVRRHGGSGAGTVARQPALIGTSDTGRLHSMGRGEAVPPRRGQGAGISSPMPG